MTHVACMGVLPMSACVVVGVHVCGSLSMKAVVLAGGLRSGLEIPGSALPRALWPFPQKPLITHVLEFLQRAGVEQMAICANGKTKLIATELSNAAQPWTNLHYSEDPLPRG